MAKPRVFISSTFYDLRSIRLELDKFLTNIGYESIRNEEGDIAYGSTESLENYCYKEISNADILISIIGNRFGTPSEGDKERSISNIELRTAIEQKKHVFIFIEKSVFIEYGTYLLNEGKENITYKYVDNINIYKFIKEVKSLRNNNNIKDFENVDDITSYLREQFAGLMKKFFIQEHRIYEMNLIKGINETAKTLKELVDYIQDTNEGKEKELKEIIKTSHPIIAELKQTLQIPYKFYIEDFNDLKNILGARKFRQSIIDKKDIYVFSRHFENSNETEKIKIKKEIFDENLNLKFYRPSEWKSDFISLEKEKIEENDLPF